MYREHYAKSANETYLNWIAAYIHFHGKRYPAFAFAFPPDSNICVKYNFSQIERARMPD